MGTSIPYPVLKKYLTRATFIFLALPYLIFFYGWLHWWLAVPMTVICLLPIVWEWKRTQETSTLAPVQEEMTIQLWQIVVVCGVALLFVLISGIGGWGWQTSDWYKHNMVLRDLIEQPWPLYYQLDGVQLPLVYYLAYYLPAALIGKLFGWVVANQALLVESWIGLSLTFLWGLVLIKRSWWKVVLLISCFSGLDILGYLLIAPVAPMLGQTVSFYNFEWWSIGWIYFSFTHVLFWVPNQGFVGWLAMSLLLKEMFDRERRYTFWYLGLTTLWSPFITLGLLPFVLVDWISDHRTLFDWLRKYSLPNLCGVLLGGLVGFMYLAKFYPLPPQISGKIIFILIFAFARNTSEVIAMSLLIALFWLFECGLYGILAWKLLDRNDRQMRLLLIVGLIYLAILPFFQYGYYNDLLHKTSIPALFALSIIVGWVVLSKSKKRGIQFALIALLVIGSMTALINISFQIEGVVQNGALWHLPSSAEVSTIWELRKEEQENAYEIPGQEYTSFLSQYVGSNEALFFQWFAR